MLIRLYRWLKGYVIVNFCGEFVEQLLNSAAKNRISIWGLSCKKQSITGCIGINNFKKLRKIRSGTHIKIKIVKKRGLPFYIRRYRSRVGFAVGAAVFFIIIKFLSGYIWTINVEGNVQVSKAQIIESCGEIGIFEGVKASRINSQNDAQRLLLLRKDLAWASLNIEGCVLNVNVTEIKDEKDAEREVPTNLKAAVDGIIKKIDVTSGNVVIKSGDVVKKGDVLVSGIIESLNSTVFVHSQGSVMAETERTVSKQGKYKSKIVKKTGDTAHRTVISFFNIKIPLYLGTVKQESIVSQNEAHLKLFKRKIPISLTTKEYKFTEEITVEYSRDELIKKLQAEIEKEIKKLPLESYSEKETQIIDTENGIAVKKTITCRENIAFEDKILLSTVN